MTNKKKFKISNSFAAASISFWMLETIFFIIRDGWHLKTETIEEKICDNICGYLIIISIIFFLSILYDMVKIFSGLNIENTSLIEEKHK